MSDTFNFRSFARNQIEKFLTPKNILVNKVRQTVDYIRLPFPSMTSTEQNSSVFLPKNETTLNLQTLEFAFPSSNSNNNESSDLCLISTDSPNLVLDSKKLADQISYHQSNLKHHGSDSDQSRQMILSRTICRNNSQIDIHALLANNNNSKPHGETKTFGRSHSPIRQTIHTTSTFPTFGSMCLIESIEIPGLYGAKAIRYVHDNLGKLEPTLYKKQILSNCPSYDSGQITFTLFYNQSSTTFVVTILSFDYLPYRNLNSKTLPNPFIKLTLLPDRRKRFQTQVYKNTQSKQFNEVFEFQISYKQLSRRILLLSVYDFCRSSKWNLIGTVKIEDICSKSGLTLHGITLTKSIVPGTEVSFLFLINSHTSKWNKYSCATTSTNSVIVQGKVLSFQTFFLFCHKWPNKKFILFCIISLCIVAGAPDLNYIVDMFFNFHPIQLILFFLNFSVLNSIK